MKGTAGFYEMFRFEPVGTYLVNVCTNISCLLWGGEELLEHACESLEVEVGGTTDDGMFTVEEAECIAACTEAPCLQVNYRYRGRVAPADFDRLVDDLRAGRTDIAGHGVLARGAAVDTGRTPGRGRPARASPRGSRLVEGQRCRGGRLMGAPSRDRRPCRALAGPIS